MSECSSIETTYYRRNRDVILNKAKKYYENNKKVLKDKVRDKYRELSEEKKNIKREYGRNRYLNISEEKKQKLKKHQKNIGKLKILNLVINIFYGLNNVYHALVMHC